MTQVSEMKQYSIWTRCCVRAGAVRDTVGVWPPPQLARLDDDGQQQRGQVADARPQAPDEPDLVVSERPRRVPARPQETD